MNMDAGIGARKADDERRVDDAELLRRYADARAEDAFSELVRRHLNLVYRAALRQLGGDGHRAEETAQVVFTVLARKAASLRRHTSLTGWLYTTTHLTVNDLRRNERRRATRESEAHLMHEISRATSTGADWERLRPVLDDVMQALDERDRDALLARFFEGHSFAAVGERLAIKEDAARMRVERALKKLRALLARRGVTSTEAALALMLANEAAAAVPVGLAASVTGLAMAGAGIGTLAAPALGLLQLMTTTKLVVGGAVLTATLIFGIALREVLARQEADERLLSASREYDALLARKREMTRRVEVAEQGVGRMPGSAVASADAGIRSNKEVPWDPYAEGRALMARHPDVRKALVDWRTAEIDFEYAALYRSAGLGSEQIERFRALMLPMRANSRLVGPQHRRVAFSSADDAPTTDPADELRKLLGEEGYREFVECRQFAPALQLAVRVAGAMCFTDTPLTAQQSAGLLQIMRSSQVPAVGRQPGRIDWDVLFVKAPAILSAPQLAVLDNLRMGEMAKQSMEASTPSK